MGLPETMARNQKKGIPGGSCTPSQLSFCSESTRVVLEKEPCPIGSARVIQLIDKEPCPSFAEIAATFRYGIGSCWELSFLPRGASARRTFCACMHLTYHRRRLGVAGFARRRQNINPERPEYERHSELITVHDRVRYLHTAGLYKRC